MKGKKCHVRLTETERKRLWEITKKGSRPARQIIRANILLRLDESGTEKPPAEQRNRRRNRRRQPDNAVVKQPWCTGSANSMSGKAWRGF
jgi:hypothetical protein